MIRQGARVLVAAALIAGGCGDESCLLGRCEGVAVCERLRYACAAPELYVGRVADDPARLDLTGASAAGDDLVLQNARVTLAIDALDQPHDLAVTGGTILDLGPRGGADALPSLYQIAGVLPDDSFAYREVLIEDRAPEHVAVVVRGALAGRPDVAVATRYELRPCEPGVRVRSELVNRSRDPYAWFLADGAHWGKRNALPFAPLAGQGFAQPELDLLELPDLFTAHPWIVARPADEDGPTYGLVPCDHAALTGVNDPEISALGTPMQIVRPGESLALERLVVAVAGGDLAAGVAEVAAARAMLHGDDPPRPLRGRVTAGGLGFGGDLRRATVLVLDTSGGARVPLTTAVPGDDGEFAASVPPGGPLAVEVWSFGRPVASARVVDGDAGDLEIALPASVSARVVDRAGEPRIATLVAVPADDATRAATRGSWFGRFGDCAPWLGPPHGASPACDRALVDEAGVDLEVPPGRYWLYASAGPDFSLARQEVALGEGDVVDLTLTLDRVASRPPGWLSADLHVHGRRSFDSSVPDLDRVRSFVAAGVELIAATDHDAIGEYDAAVAALGVADRVQVVGGLETTGLVPFLAVPGDDLPRVIGHFNFWPLAAAPGEPRGGAPVDEMLEPGALFDRMAPLIGEGGVRQLNHPWDEPQFGRDLGYLRAIGYDPRRPIPSVDDGSNNGMLARAPLGGRRNLDFDTIEIQNGAGGALTASARPLWRALLAGGHVRPGTASSDSHGLTDAQLGYGRTLCPVGSLADLDVEDFDRALLDGRCVGGNGVVVTVEVVDGAGRRGLGFTPVVPSDAAALAIEVRAPPWIPVTEVRAATSRGVARLATIDVQPDPLGTDGALRYQGSVRLADLDLAAGDDFVIIEAGVADFAVDDLDDDGVPDTTDNDGDGDVDRDDVEDPDDDAGPLRSPADPADPADPRFHLTRVVPGAWPYGFAGPLLIDRAGDGWEPPGVAR